MTIKEVEEILGIPRASIRFYEKEQLIDPKRGDNGDREYDEKDVATLKKVIFTVIIVCLAWGVERWLVIERSLYSFLIGIAIPLITTAFLVIIGYPLHCLLKRNPKTAKHEKWIIWTVALFVCIVILDLATKYNW